MKLKLPVVIFTLIIGGLMYTIINYKLDPSLLAQLSFYENLANPYVRIVYVPQGLRKEEIADIVANKLDWNSAEKNDFINAHFAADYPNPEGHYFPETYMLNINETPSEVTSTMFQEFSKQISKVSIPKSRHIINQETAVKIASIIQRESNGTDADMKLVSGIIWNRIFSGMKLQMDATLQYAKGNEVDGWWEEVSPKDLQINSSYNTYLHTGLPPGAIANPGLAAIDAAYNPTKTDCLFYLHDKNRQIHCSPTYAGHLENIKKYY